MIDSKFGSIWCGGKHNFYHEIQINILREIFMAFDKSNAILIFLLIFVLRCQIIVRKCSKLFSCSSNEINICIFLKTVLKKSENTKLKSSKLSSAICWQFVAYFAKKNSLLSRQKKFFFQSPKSNLL